MDDTDSLYAGHPLDVQQLLSSPCSSPDACSYGRVPVSYTHLENIKAQMSKLGDTIYEAYQVELLKGMETYFVPNSILTRPNIYIRPLFVLKFNSERTYIFCYLTIIPNICK